MAYHPLSNDTGGDAKQRRDEANRIIAMLTSLDENVMTQKESEFVQSMDSNGADVPVSPKQLFWLRDIKDKYL
jgi:hypothetical protein